MLMTKQESNILARVLLGVDIAEVLSSVRVAKVCVCVKFGLMPGSSLDLSIGWDFDDVKQCGAAMGLVDKQNRFLHVSAMQNVLRAAGHLS